MAKTVQRQRNTLSRKKDKGESRIIEKKESMDTSYSLNWFQPAGKQQLIVDSIGLNDLTIVDAPSGTGKSSTVLWKCLSDYAAGRYRQLWLIKNPTEAGDDQIGFLPNSAEDKISVHMEAMKSIFYQFISKNKLENDVKSDNIVLTIPNFCLGITIDYSLVVVEEAQTMSPNTIKLITERAGKGTKVIVVGDSKQRYSAKKRDDGMRDLIYRVTQENEGVRTSKYPNVGYVRLDSSNNMRSELSRLITEIYDD